MIIGIPSRFAVEFDLDPDRAAYPADAEWLFGRVRWWCAGAPVGRYERITTLRDVATTAKRTIATRGQRRDKQLARTEPRAALEMIRRGLYVDEGQSDEQVALDSARFTPFVVSPVVDVFDPWLVVAIDGVDDTHLVWQLRREKSLPEVQRLHFGELEDVLARFIRGVEQWP